MIAEQHPRTNFRRIKIFAHRLGAHCGYRGKASGSSEFCYTDRHCKYSGVSHVEYKDYRRYFKQVKRCRQQQPRQGHRKKHARTREKVTALEALVAELEAQRKSAEK